MPKIIEYPDELTHYGRLGMKWGQHIFTDSDPTRRKATRREKREYFDKVPNRNLLKTVNRHPVPRFIVNNAGDRYKRQVFSVIHSKNINRIKKLIDTDDNVKSMVSTLDSIRKKSIHTDPELQVYKDTKKKLASYISSKSPRNEVVYSIPDSANGKREIKTVKVKDLYARAWEYIDDQADDYAAWGRLPELLANDRFIDQALDYVAFSSYK